MKQLNEERLTAYLDSLLELGVPSVDCMVLRDHQVLYRHTAGTQDAERKVPVQKNQAYLMFSMTKIQTMTAVLSLIEKGELSLEDPVSKFLPAYKNTVVKRPDGSTEKGKPILIKHLVSMQSGLDYDLGRPGIIRVMNEQKGQANTIELVNSFVESPLLFQPGEHFCYSLSHDVAAAVVEVITGMRFGEYLEKLLWIPLGMKGTYFASPNNEQYVGKVLNPDRGPLAVQFCCEKDGTIHPMDPVCDYQFSDWYESGGAGLISCTEDYAALGDMLACGGISAEGVRILKPETVELIKENQLGPVALRDIAVNMGRVGYGYGIGMQVLMNPKEIHSTSPVGVFGWDGAAGSCLTMDTASKTTLVYIEHVRNHGYSYGVIHPTLRDLVFGE